MIKSVIFGTYRTIYCIALGLSIVVLLRRLPIGESLRPSEIPLFYAFTVSVALVFFTAAAFSRVPEWISWIATLAMCALFVWYTWFSLGAPFVLHELHTFDPVEADKEIRDYRDRALIGTATMLGFFLLLPVLRHFNHRRNHIPNV